VLAPLLLCAGQVGAHKAPPLAVVTGANVGIGFHVAGQLAAKGYHVVLGCRNRARAEEAIARLRTRFGEETHVEFSLLDLGSFNSVQQFAAGLLSSHQKLDLLVCNAGLNSASAPQEPNQQLTVDGVDLIYQTNFLSHLLLILLLLPLLKAAQGRVINISSVMHRSASTDKFQLVDQVRSPYVSLYGLSKLSQILVGTALHRRYGEEVSFHCVNPGGVASDIWRDYPAWKRRLLSLLLMSPAAAAETVVASCLCEEGRAPSRPRYWNGYCGAGRHTFFEYWSPLRAGTMLVPSEPSLDACNNELAEEVWRQSATILREKVDFVPSE